VQDDFFWGGITLFMGTNTSSEITSKSSSVKLGSGSPSSVALSLNFIVSLVVLLEFTVTSGLAQQGRTNNNDNAIVLSLPIQETIIKNKPHKIYSLVFIRFFGNNKSQNLIMFQFL
jgi:hypothetical protein